MIDVSSYPTLRYGSDGDYVSLMQSLLIQRGQSLPGYGVDGKFRSETQKAVISFQSSVGITADGICGPVTWRKLLGEETAPAPTQQMESRSSTSSSDEYSGGARRTMLSVTFDGVDISDDISNYLISLTYTDNEEDETDDLQISLHDTEGIWLTDWLTQLVVSDTGSAPAPVAAASTGGTYSVTAPSGLHFRSGPSTSYRSFGALPFGTQVTVTDNSGSWFAVSHGGQNGYMYAQWLAPVDNGGGSGGNPGTAALKSGFKIQATINRYNWDEDEKLDTLDCGQFELDAISASGPPSSITIKASSLSYANPIRQTKKDKAWEKYTLSRIAQEIASANGMACVYESSTDITYARIEQGKMSDIAFLSKLCKDAGISLKCTNNQLVLFDQQTYEAKPSVMSISFGDGSYTKYRLSTGEADTQYASCRVSYTDPATGALIEGIAKTADFDQESKTNQQLEIHAKVSSAVEAQELAKKHLRLHNKYEKECQFTLPGNTSMTAGVTVRLHGFGLWNGKYIVKTATHSVSSSGYTTTIKLRNILEGY